MEHAPCGARAGDRPVVRYVCPQGDVWNQSERGKHFWCSCRGIDFIVHVVWKRSRIHSFLFFFVFFSCSQPSGFYLTMNNYRSGEEEGGVNSFAFFTCPKIRLASRCRVPIGSWKPAAPCPGGAKDWGASR